MIDWIFTFIAIILLKFSIYRDGYFIKCIIVFEFLLSKCLFDIGMLSNSYLFTYPIYFLIYGIKDSIFISICTLAKSSNALWAALFFMLSELINFFTYLEYFSNSLYFYNNYHIFMTIVCILQLLLLFKGSLIENFFVTNIKRLWFTYIDTFYFFFCFYFYKKNYFHLQS